MYEWSSVRTHAVACRRWKTSRLVFLVKSADSKQPSGLYNGR